MTEFISLPTMLQYPRVEWIKKNRPQDSREARHRQKERKKKETTHTANRMNATHSHAYEREREREPHCAISKAYALPFSQFTTEKCCTEVHQIENCMHDVVRCDAMLRTMAEDQHRHIDVLLYYYESALAIWISVSVAAPPPSSSHLPPLPTTRRRPAHSKQHHFGLADRAPCTRLISISLL